MAPPPLRPPTLAPGGMQTCYPSQRGSRLEIHWVQAWLGIVGKLVCTSREVSLHGVSWQRIDLGQEDSLMGLTRVMGWGRDSECGREAITQTLPGGTRPCGSGVQNIALAGSRPHRRQHKGKVPALLSRPTWSLAEQHEVGVLDCFNSCHYQHRCRTSIHTPVHAYIFSFTHIHGFSLRHMGSGAAEF